MTTLIFESGISLLNKSEVNLVMDLQGFNLNIMTFLQVLGRFREAKKINLFFIDRGQEKALMDLNQTRLECNKFIKRLNDGADPDAMKQLTGIFNEAIDKELGEYKINEDGLEIAMHKFNATSWTSQGILGECGISYKEYKVLDIEEEEEEKLKAKKRPKTFIKEMLGEIGEKPLIAYLVARANKQDWNYLRDDLKPLLEGINKENRFRKSIDTLVGTVRGCNHLEIKRALYKYLNLVPRFDKVTFTDKQACIEEIEELGAFHKSFTQVRKVLSKHSIDFVDSKAINVKTIKEICKEQLGIEFKKASQICSNMVIK